MVPQVPTKYRLGPSRFFGIHLVPQVSKPDKFGLKPDFEHVDRFWPPQNRLMNSNLKRNFKKIWNFLGRICLHAQDGNKISGSFSTRGARGKKNKNICLMNNKFKKSKQNQKFWNFLGSNMLTCARCDQNFVMKWHRTGSSKFLSFFEVFF